MPPFYPNGLEFPNRKGTQLFAPSLYWVENVPTGLIEANLTILNTPFILEGYGGRERNWLPLSWVDVSAHWDMIRGVVGPYRYIGWVHHSAIEGSQFSMVLFQDEKIIFRTTNSQPSDSNPWATLTRADTGPVHLASAPDDAATLPESTFTGYIVEIIAPKTGDHWRFDVNFTQTVYWFQAGQAALIGGYTAQVSGGLIGECTHKGVSSGNAQERLS